MDRFWSKVKIGEADECWPWQASCFIKTGYGKFSIGGKKGTMALAHRVAWELKNGPVPEGFEVCHTCDNPPCCNLSHLFLGTHQDNMTDMVNKGRGRSGNVYGEQHGMVKLTESQVFEIRQLWSTGNYKQWQLADMFGVKQQNISFIVNNKTWRIAR